MESLSRPSHRRKHSTAANAFSSSFNNPYNDVFVSKRGKGKPLQLDDYTEIFSGSSSIPLLDIPSHDNRPGSADSRISVLDYFSIFGGLRNDDVAVPYEELLSVKTSKPRIPADSVSFLPQSGSAHSSTNTRSSNEVSKQSVEGAKKQFNKSFSQKNQRNSDALNGETHIARLHSVTGFTHFVDERNRPQLGMEDHKPVPPLKREVSRTWSFSAEVEDPKGKHDLRSEKSHLPNLSDNMNEVGPKSRYPNLPSSSSHPSNPSDSKNPPRPRVLNFASEETNSECSLPFLDGEFDENSVAAASAAVLEKAIEQAQESIRLAKIIMERKREGYEDSSKTRSNGFMRDLDKEAKADPATYCSETNNYRGGYEDLLPNFTGIDGSVPFPSQNVEEGLQKKVEATKECVGAVTGEDELFASRENGGKGIYTDKTAELNPPLDNVEEANMHTEVTNDPGLVASIENRTMDLISAEVVEIEEQEDAQNNEREVTAKADEPADIATLGKVGENMKTHLEEHVPKQESDIDGLGKCEMKSEECKLLNEDYSTAVKAPEEFLDESFNIVKNEVPELEEMEDKPESLSNWEENGNCERVYDKEENDNRGEESRASFETREQPMEALLEDINIEMEPNVFSEIDLSEKNDDAHEPEIEYKKQNNARDEEEPQFPGELEHNKIDESCKSSSRRESSKSIITDAEDAADIQKKDVSGDAVETNYIHIGTEQSEEDEDICEYQEAAYEEEIDEVVDASGTIFSESQETCEVDFNYIAEEYKKAVNGGKEDDSMAGVPGTSSEIDRGTKAEQLFNPDEMDSGSQFSPEGSSYDDNTDNVTVTDSVTKEMSATGSRIYYMSQDHATQTNTKNQADICTSDNGKVEFDVTGVRVVLEQTSESDEGSVSNCSYENVDDILSHESENCAEIAKDEASDKGESADELEVYSESECAKEQSEEACSELHGKPKETAKFMETGRTVETSTEKNKDDIPGPSNIGEKNAKECTGKLEREERQEKIEVMKKRREQEKEKLAVERAIREARERAFAEARERAERAAVERAAAEVRQRVLAEAQEKIEKDSTVKPPAGKASAADLLKAERAAVGRATAEARERALEKAMSQKNLTESRTKFGNQTESSGNIKLKHSFSSSDLETGTSTESPQRRKARLERHQRIMERAAMALAEKNKRDIIAQREQAERNRLAESLDADIKRWASGKEGNLRALLSTLQYILGADSGWQPISLTEIITAVAVKKAYRKATLYVHPDKLQQRGATIQQKYVCEKVFFLLKAAWNKFSSDER